MANLDHFLPHLLRWEAGVISKGETPRLLFEKARNHGWSDDLDDAGGKTMCGVTWATWQRYCMSHGRTATVAGLRHLSFDTWRDIVKTFYWRAWKADDIQNQSIAELLVDWVWGSGSPGITIPQKQLNVAADGIVGPITLQALNGANQSVLYEVLWLKRRAFLVEVSKKRNNAKFLRGWLNRLESQHFSLNK